MKIGAGPDDKMYEDLMDMNKLKSILIDVRYRLIIILHLFVFCFMIDTLIYLLTNYVR